MEIVMVVKISNECGMLIQRGNIGGVFWVISIFPGAYITLWDNK